MTLDIIIPTFNEYENLRILLPYLQNLIDKSRTRIIVVDAHCSDDDSASLFDEFNIEYHKTTKTSRASQLNYGARMGQSDALLFLHADVRPPDDFVAQIEQGLRDYQYGLFGYKFSPSSTLLGINARATKKKSVFSGGGDQSLFISRSLFEESKGYNEEQVIMEDFELFDRLQKGGDYALIQSPAIVSSRKYVKNSWLRVNLVNLLAFSLFRIGASPNIIQRFCQRWLRKDAC